MERGLIVAIVVLTSSACSLLMVRSLIPAALRLQLVDKMPARGVTKRPVPRVGGIGVLVGFAAGLGISFSLDVDRFPSEVERIALLVVAGAILLLVMVVDDVQGIGPLSKLVIQFGACSILVLPRLRGANHGLAIDSFNAPFLGEVSLPVAGAVLVTLLWLVGMINSMNWIDGIDGLAGALTVVACGVLFLHTFFWPRADPQFTIAILPVALGGATLGFLVYNWFPSRIMLGDAGSNFLGLALGAIAIIGGAKLATLLLVFALPVLDAIWVVTARLLHGQSPFAADRRHLHHRLLDRGWSQSRIVVVVTGASAFFGALALVLPTRELKLVAILLTGILLLATLGGAKEAATADAPTESHQIPG